MGSNVWNLSGIYQSPTDQSKLQRMCSFSTSYSEPSEEWVVILLSGPEQEQTPPLALAVLPGDTVPSWLSRYSGDRSHLSIAQASQVWSPDPCRAEMNSAPPPPAELGHCVFVQPIYLFNFKLCTQSSLGITILLQAHKTLFIDIRKAAAG